MTTPKKRTEYLLTYENGSQKVFKFLHEIQLCCELSPVEIKKAIKTGEPTYDNVVRQKIWIEELA